MHDVSANLRSRKMWARVCCGYPWRSQDLSFVFGTNASKCSHSPWAQTAVPLQDVCEVITEIVNLKTDF